MALSARDWQAKHFFFLSLIVTALSIIFLFAVHQLSNKLRSEGEGALWFRSLLSGGGFLVESIRLESNEEESFFPDSMREPVYLRVEALKNRFLLSLGADEALSPLESIPWLKSVSVKRNWPGELKVRLAWELPSLAVYSGNGWVLVNESGDFIAHSKVLFGSWVDLPQVYGLEDVLRRDVEEMNRSLQQEKLWLQDLQAWRKTLQDRLQLKVLHSNIEWDAWNERPIFSTEVETDSGERSFEIRVAHQQWRNKISSLQYVLTDIITRNLEQNRLSGELPGRWLAQKKRGDS